MQMHSFASISIANYDLSQHCGTNASRHRRRCRCPSDYRKEVTAKSERYFPTNSLNERMKINANVWQRQRPPSTLNRKCQRSYGTWLPHRRLLTQHLCTRVSIYGYTMHTRTVYRHHRILVCTLSCAQPHSRVQFSWPWRWRNGEYIMAIINTSHTLGVVVLLCFCSVQHAKRCQ